MFRTQTRSWRVATCASELMPTKYLNSPTPSLYMSISLERSSPAAEAAHLRRHLLAPAGLHPGIGLLCVLDDFAHVRVKAEQPIGQAERLAGIAQRAEAAHQVRPAAARDDVQRRGALRAEVLAQGIGHRAEGFE